MNSNFGKYNIPATLEKLIQFESMLDDPEQFYLCFQFYLSMEGDRYFNTPSDVVVFGRIGVDGVHYGFLTDYGSAADLETAPIVCVSPMDFDAPTRIVARNIKEFLGINLTDSSLFYNQFGSEEKYLAAKARWAEEAESLSNMLSEKDSLVREEAEKFLRENIQVPHIENPYRYVETAAIERQKVISIQTQDGLGVTAPLLQGEEHIPFPFQPHQVPDKKKVEEYLLAAPTASKLALFRNTQLNLDLMEYPEIYVVVIEAMKKIGLTDEVKRISEGF
ncbi:hypothetical protein [Bacillus sp. AG4(2022)]|uniref:hypothetical protein n=1 Tax=Bacillus sp. AG4(2022) TaxID=2962594 RepID=UPI0028810CFD|nr:hypothetical protein [Bacillus sp. AG4(2022)]MDT0161313.1 hypothetical protein [Bacillus sp. AG4(2022)]